MKTNKLDNNIKEKFANRTFEPSVSAWERLSAQLDEQPKQKKKGWFFYIGYAASILALISIGFYTFSNKDQVELPDTIIVESAIDTISIKNNIEQHFNETSVEEAIVETKKVEEKQDSRENFNNNVIVNKVKNTLPKKKNNKVSKKIDKTIIAQVNKTNTTDISSEKEIKKTEKATSRIKVNADYLLFAVTNSTEKATKYYAKNNVSRDDVLKTIKSELKKSNLKVNPETILAEVERNINDDAFQNNFLKSLKKKISNIATAIASRND
tara:strand:- start:2825 stop:3628 length:804 start_codon:yes stop_codon:yes gene_type:complete